MTEVKDEHQQNGAEEMGEDNDVGNSEEGGANDTAAADEDYKPSDSSASSEATEEEDDPPSPGRKNTRMGGMILAGACIRCDGPARRYRVHPQGVVQKTTHASVDDKRA